MFICVSEYLEPHTAHSAESMWTVLPHTHSNVPSFLGSTAPHLQMLPETALPHRGQSMVLTLRIPISLYFSRQYGHSSVIIAHSSWKILPHPQTLTNSIRFTSPKQMSQ